MRNIQQIENDEDNIHRLDITGLICPMTFVRTKLTLEKLAPGALLAVRLKGDEPLSNVPRSAKQHGHTVISIEPADEDGVHIVTLRREDV